MAGSHRVSQPVDTFLVWTTVRLTDLELQFFASAQPFHHPKTTRLGGIWFCAPILANCHIDNTSNTLYIFGLCELYNNNNTLIIKRGDTLLKVSSISSWPSSLLYKLPLARQPLSMVLWFSLSSMSSLPSSRCSICSFLLWIVLSHGHLQMLRHCIYVSQCPQFLHSS